MVLLRTYILYMNALYQEALRNSEQLSDKNYFACRKQTAGQGLGLAPCRRTGYKVDLKTLALIFYS